MVIFRFLSVQSEGVSQSVVHQRKGLARTMIGTAMVSVRKMYTPKAYKEALQVLESSLNLDGGISILRC